MALVVAVLLGLPHATGPDHLTAVFTLFLGDRRATVVGGPPASGSPAGWATSLRCSRPLSAGHSLPRLSASRGPAGGTCQGPCGWALRRGREARHAALDTRMEDRSPRDPQAPLQFVPCGVSRRFRVVSAK